MPDKEALDALTFFASNYEPATKENATNRFSTNEISNAVAEHTGMRLASSEIYTAMQQMGYTYEATEALEFVWLLKK